MRHDALPPYVSVRSSARWVRTLRVTCWTGSIGGPGIEDNAAAGTTEYTHDGVAVASTIAHIPPCRKSARRRRSDRPGRRTCGDFMVVSSVFRRRSVDDHRSDGFALVHQVEGVI